MAEGAGDRPAAVRTVAIPAGGLAFDALAAGPPDGPLVVLLHGFAQPTAAWEPQLAALAGAGFLAVAPAQRGYCAGARPSRVEGYRIERLVGDVLALAGALGHTRFHLAGFDTGGAIAWHVAGSRPDAVLSLTAVSTPHPRALVRAVFAGPQAVRSAYIPAFWVPRLPERVLGGGHNDGLPRFLVATGLDAGRADRYAAGLPGPRELAATLAFFRAMRPWALREMGTVDVPITFVWGTANRVIGRRAARGTARYAGAGYRFLPQPGQGHWLLETGPDVVSEALLASVGRRERR